MPANATLSTTSYTYGITCTGSLGGVYSDKVTISVPPTASVTVTVTASPTCAAYIGTPGTTSYTVTPTSTTIDGTTVPDIGITWSDGVFRPTAVSLLGDLPLSTLKNDTTGETGRILGLTSSSTLTAMLAGTVSTASSADLTIDGAALAGTGSCTGATIHIGPAPTSACKITPGSSTIAFASTSTENAIPFRVTKLDGTVLEAPLRASLDTGTTGYTYDPFAGMAAHTMTVVFTDGTPINFPGVFGFIPPDVGASPGAVVDLTGAPPAAGTHFTLTVGQDTSIGEDPVECSAVYTVSTGSGTHRPPWKEI